MKGFQGVFLMLDFLHQRCEHSCLCQNYISLPREFACLCCVRSNNILSENRNTIYRMKTRLPSQKGNSCPRTFWFSHLFSAYLSSQKVSITHFAHTVQLGTVHLSVLWVSVTPTSELAAWSCGRGTQIEGKVEKFQHACRVLMWRICSCSGFINNRNKVTTRQKEIERDTLCVKVLGHTRLSWRCYNSNLMAILRQFRS